MSGHSKWSTIKHKKAAQDAKRGKAFDRLNKEIMVAARVGGADPDSNPRLRTAIAKARQLNMPSDNIKRAIQKGLGELPGQQIEEVTYEGYGPAGVAVFVEAMTDNKNRTVGEIRHVFSKHGGNLAASGSVSYLFRRRGMFVIEQGDEEAILAATLDAGVEDVYSEDGNVVVLCDVSSFSDVEDALAKANIKTTVAELSMIPTTKVELEESDARKVLRLIEALEENEDVQNVYANFEMSDAVLAAVG
ncbi:YebC/PmpR family DNA-binding transcriptional regulator [bacterium]|nr:YebC/PmpR family DNA-binding transcriptional regulator [bacterium]